MLVKHIQPRDSRENQTLLMLCGCLSRQEAKSVPKIFGVCSEKCEMPASLEMRDASSKMVLDGSHCTLLEAGRNLLLLGFTFCKKSALSPSALFANVKGTLPLWDSTKILRISCNFRRIEKSNQNLEIVIPNLKFSYFFPPLPHFSCIISPKSRHFFPFFSQK